MKKKFFKKTNDKSISKQNIKYRIKDKDRLYEISSAKHGWQPVELIKFIKNGRVVLRLIFSNQIIVRKIGKKMRPYQRR